MHRIERLYYETDGKCYLSFSGGKDSTVVLAVIKMCEEIGTIPKNAIPAVFCDTRIELDATVDFVKWIKDNWYSNVQIIKPEISFAQVIKGKGKPFRSKMKSACIRQYKNKPNSKTARYLYDDTVCKSNKMRLSNKDFHVLHDDFDIKIADACCEEMKKKPFAKYAKENGSIGYFTGMRMFEGGKRQFTFEKRLQTERPCTAISNGYVSVSPVFDWNDETLENFIEKYNVPLSKAYTEYGERRTGCFLCPYGLQKNVKDRLETLYKYEPNKYKAAMYYMRDIYIAQSVELPFDEEYMREYRKKWEKYEVMRYEMLKKYRPDCMICKKCEDSCLQQPDQLKLFKE